MNRLLADMERIEETAREAASKKHYMRLIVYDQLAFLAVSILYFTYNIHLITRKVFVA